MKLCQELPETEHRLKSGKLSLSSASQLQTFFEKQAKQVKKARELKPKKPTEGQNQVSPVETRKQNNKTAVFNLEQKRNLIKKAEGRSSRETIKLLSETDPSIPIKKDHIRFLEKGKVEIKMLIDGKCYKQLEELKHLLSHKNPARTISRTIPSHIKKWVWERDKNQCSYVHPKTQHRCSSKHLLQIDHIQPFALNGRSEPNNLRLLCASHNQYRNRKRF